MADHRDKKSKKVLTEDLELHIIEIPKAKRVLAKEANNRIAQWLVFLDNPNTERVEEIMKENEDVKKAKEVLSQMSEDEELQMLAELHEKWDIDERSALASAKDEGKIEIATNMLKEGTSIEFIQKVTGLAIEELEKIPEYAEREDLQRLAELHEKWDLDERSALDSARDDRSLEIATNMLKEGTSIEFIQKVTGLTKEEIEKLQK